MSIQWDQGGRPFTALDDVDGSRELMKGWVLNDQDGQEFAAKYRSSKNVERVAEVLNLHGMQVSPANLSWVYQRLRDSGQLSTPQPVPELDVPRDKNGRALSAAQIQWGEMLRWSESASSNEIHLRRQNDPAYREFYLTNLKREMEDQPIDGDCRPFNPHLNPQKPPSLALADPGLVVFADRWRGMSMAEIRSARSRAINPLTAQKFIDDEARAMKLGLI